jgi:endonuclease YncB( thermonuclease family)
MGSMDVREQVRGAIRAEVARQNPVEDARHSLELIAETAVRFEGEDSVGYRIIDENGEARTRVDNGATVDFTIRDLVADLRDKHPTLFQAAPLDPSEALDDPLNGMSPTDKVDAVPSDQRELASAAPAPAPAEVASDEFSMPRAAPFGPNLSGSSFDAPLTTSPDVAARVTRSATASPRGPRDWLILDGGKRPTEEAASAPPSSEPSSASVVSAVTPVRPAPAEANSAPPAGPPVARPLANEGRRGGRRPATMAYAVLGGLAVLSTGAYLALGSRASGPDLLPKQTESKATESRQAERARARTTPAPQPQADPLATGSVSSSPATEPTSARPGPAEPAPITGVPEVIDTATLRVDGKVVRLIGVEWARGGRADNLTSYLGGREVTCQPAEASELYRCKVEGRDLSQVVLYNGGGRASPNAPADLLAAENYARTERIGVWQK